LKKAGANYSLTLSDYRNLDQVLTNEKINQIQGMILDLGLSSNQLADSGRGFSFQTDEPLLMTFATDSNDSSITAQLILNKWSEKTLADIIYAYGDERYARRIAKKIVAVRQKKEIKTTNDLVEIISQSVPIAYQKGKTHFATKTFQAIRMAVNDELGALREGLKKGFIRLTAGGRLAVISFHSGEDRIIKNYFRDLVKEKKAILVNKKPIIASPEEIKRNPRSRSAKLRILEKCQNKEKKE
jgi:16S rRNA (cytosine1402-N4)-methyltransferase